MLGSNPDMIRIIGILLRSIRDWDGARNGFGRQQTFCYRVNLYILCTHKAQIGYGLLGKEHVTSAVLINRWLVWTNYGRNHTRKHYPVHGTSWINRKGIMPTKRSLTDKCVLNAFNDMTFQRMQNRRDRNHQWLPSEGGGRWLDAKEYEGTLEAHENVLQIKEKMAMGSWVMAWKGAKEHCRTFWA